MSLADEDFSQPTFTYYFLENGEVVFIENFHNALEAKEHKAKYFPKSTVALRLGGQDTGH